jgi:hypothetical protein
MQATPQRPITGLRFHMPSLYDAPFSRLEFICGPHLYPFGRHLMLAPVLGRHFR